MDQAAGEDGKTQPSLASLLGVPCRCLQLDVVSILDSEGNEEAQLASPPPFGAGL